MIRRCTRQFQLQANPIILISRTFGELDFGVCEKTADGSHRRLYCNVQPNVSFTVVCVVCVGRSWLDVMSVTSQPWSKLAVAERRVPAAALPHTVVSGFHCE